MSVKVGDKPDGISGVLLALSIGVGIDDDVKLKKNSAEMAHKIMDEVLTDRWYFGLEADKLISAEVRQLVERYKVMKSEFFNEPKNFAYVRGHTFKPMVDEINLISVKRAKAGTLTAVDAVICSYMVEDMIATVELIQELTHATLTDLVTDNKVTFNKESGMIDTTLL